MTTAALTEPPASAGALGTRARAPDVLDAREPLGGLPPLLSLVPQAGPPVFVYLGLGVVLLLLLVPPLALLATLMGVALVVASALVALVVLAVAILEAPLQLVRLLHAHRPRRLFVPVVRMPHAKVRRV